MATKRFVAGGTHVFSSCLRMLSSSRCCCFFCLFAVLLGTLFSNESSSPSSSSSPFPAAQGQVLFLNTTVVPNIRWPSELGPFRVGEHRNLTLLVSTANETAWSGPVEISCERALGCPLIDPSASSTASQPKPTSTGTAIVRNVLLEQANGFAEQVPIRVHGTFMGLNRLVVRINRKQFRYWVRTWKSHWGSTLTELFTVALGVATVVGNLLAGIQSEFDAHFVGVGARSYLLRAMAVAGICQFLLVPLIGFCIAKYLLATHPFVLRLALFMCSCAPAGSGKSAFWSVLFDGNLQLVAALATLQRVGTLVSLPLWLHFLGAPTFFVDQRVRIPWRAVSYGLALMAGPFLVGVLLKVAGARQWMQGRGVAKCAKTLLWLATLLFTALAALVTWQGLFLLTWDLLLSIGVLLPCAAHIVTFLLAKIFCLNQRDAHTLAIECGVQSSGVTGLILLLALGEPERDVALAIPAAVCLLTDKPLLVFCFARIGKRAILSFAGRETRGMEAKVSAFLPNGQSQSGANIMSNSADPSVLQLERAKQLDERAETQEKTTMRRGSKRN